MTALLAELQDPTEDPTAPRRLFALPAQAAPRAPPPAMVQGAELIATRAATDRGSAERHSVQNFFSLTYPLARPGGAGAGEEAGGQEAGGQEAGGQEAGGQDAGEEGAGQAEAEGAEGVARAEVHLHGALGTPAPQVTKTVLTTLALISMRRFIASDNYVQYLLIIYITFFFRSRHSIVRVQGQATEKR